MHIQKDWHAFNFSSHIFIFQTIFVGKDINFHFDTTMQMCSSLMNSSQETAFLFSSLFCENEKKTYAA